MFKTESLLRLYCFVLCFCVNSYYACVHIFRIFVSFEDFIWWIIYFSCIYIYRVVNIAVSVSLAILSAILFLYRHQYRQYFWKPVSVTVSAILLTQFFADTRYRYFWTGELGGNCPVTIIDIMLCKNCQRGAATKKYWTCTVCGNLLINRGHVIQVHITTVKKFTLSLLGCIIKCLLCSVH
jgi:hypothetical protein